MALDIRAPDRRQVLGGLVATIVPLPASAAVQNAAVPAAPGLRTIEARAGTLRLVPAGETAIWGYDGQVPGPLLRIRHGDDLNVRLVNKLAQPTTLTWHGVRATNAMDGVAGLTQAPVAPGASFDYRFTPPDAGLFWYHPHVWPTVAEQVERGLYGVLIVDEPEPPAVDRDLLVVLDDWQLAAKGQIAADFLDPRQAGEGDRIGSMLTLNARPVPLTDTMRPASRLRLRLLNVCGARIALVSIVGAAVTVVAIDGQPSELFKPADGTVPIGPGARFELMLDLPVEGGQAVKVILRGDNGPDRPLMTIATAGAPVVGRPAFTRLPDNPLLPTRIHLERSVRHEIIIGGGEPVAPPPVNIGGKTAPASPDGKAANLAAIPPPAAPIAALPSAPMPLWTIDGKASKGPSPKPLFTVKRNTPVTLTFVNRTSVPQQLHVHGHVWRLLHDLDDGWDPYWRDSVLLAPGRTKHVAFIADNPGKWALESAIRDRQDTGLATWFMVT